MILIEKDVILSGGWTEDFMDRSPYVSMFDANHYGAGIQVLEGVTATLEKVGVADTGRWGCCPSRPHSARRILEKVGVADTGRQGTAIYGSGPRSGERGGMAPPLGVAELPVAPVTDPPWRPSDSSGEINAGIYNVGTLTLIDSWVADTTKGCGIDNRGTLTLGRSAVYNTRETGICNFGALTMEESISYYNDGSCGGLLNHGGRVTLRRSALYANFAMGGEAGGMCNAGEAMLIDSSVVGNDTVFYGWKAATWPIQAGGIHNTPAGRLTLVNSTVTGNDAEAAGGGIFNEGTLTLRNVTLVGNGSNVGAGGLHNQGTLHIQNSILALNHSGQDNQPADCAGVLVSEGYNLLGDTTGCDWSASVGDLLNVHPAFTLAAWSGASPYARGSQLYYALAPFSPAVDAGNPAGCPDAEGVPLATDQIGRPRPVDGNGDGVKRCDLGSYEYDPATDTNSYHWLPLIGR